MEPEYIIIRDPYEVQKVRNERFQSMRWSGVEKAHKDRPKFARKFFQGRQIPFKLLSEVKFKRSLFGMFLHHFNPRQDQDYFLNDNKLAMLNYDHQTFTADRLVHLEEDNNFALDLRDLLVKAVDEKELIDMDFLYENILALKFVDTPLTFLDTELLKFKYLRILILCADWLTDICGSNLPSTLQYIELFGNQIEYIGSFCKHVPKKLVHIGMGRNWLNNDSGLHLLGNSGKFSCLRSLDLSENDIYELDQVLDPLAKLGSLFSLHLQGNPCSVINIYKDRVLHFLPELVRLDNTEILDLDRDIDSNSRTNVSACINFTCHRIMGLPKPKKSKKFQDFYYFSISMPLLEEVVVLKEPNLIETEKSEEIMKKPKKGKKDKDNIDNISKKSTKSKKSSKKSSKKERKKSPYDAPDEYQPEIESRKIDTTFKTERFPWSKMIQLPESCLLIESPEGNHTDIRDTFRSSVNVKLIYLQIEPPQKKKGSTKGSKKSSVKGTKNKNTKKPKKKKDNDKKSVTTKDTTLETSKVEEPPKERINKKLTLADFFCDLHSINWSDKSIDFYWADHPKTKSNAIEIDGNLRAVQYSEKVKSPKGKKKGKSASKSGGAGGDTTQTSMATGKVVTPKIFTIQVGFGLVRSYKLDNQLAEPNRLRKIPSHSY